MRLTGCHSLCGEVLSVLRGGNCEERMEMNKKTTRSYVEHRNCHPNRVTFSNPWSALDFCTGSREGFQQ
jgi:hypothetical protein